MYGSTMVRDMYESNMVGDKLEPNDQIICDAVRLKTKKGNDITPIFSLGHSNQDNKQPSF